MEAKRLRWVMSHHARADQRNSVDAHQLRWNAAVFITSSAINVQNPKRIVIRRTAISRCTGQGTTVGPGTTSDESVKRCSIISSEHKPDSCCQISAYPGFPSCLSFQPQNDWCTAGFMAVAGREAQVKGRAAHVPLGIRTSILAMCFEVLCRKDVC